MTYFGFLAFFVGIPVLILAGFTWRDHRQGLRLPNSLRAYSAGLILLAHAVVALVYTTPWDNYLVATGVWFYNPQLVTGLTIGWVPIEEYTFFAVQPILTGLWWLYWARRWPEPAAKMAQSNGRWRIATLSFLSVIWFSMAIVLYADWQPGTYLALQLVWALPPIMLQLAFGGDILWRYRRLVAQALLPTVLYLSLADALAIQSGTWTIDPAQSLQWYLGGVLPLEELLFFLFTNVLIVFGMTLVLAQESWLRAAAVRLWWQRQVANKAAILRRTEG